MTPTSLFPDEAFMAAPEQATVPAIVEPARVLEADRKQIRMAAVDMEELLPPDHRARSIWDAVGGLDLSAFYREIVARGSAPGRPAVDPKILVALWLYATTEGIGSARHVARLCERDDAYRWICGGVSVNHHLLSDFRVMREGELDELLTQVIAVMMHQGLVTLKRVAQDGMRVRASAGAASFRREESLRACLEGATQQVQSTKKEMNAEAPENRKAKEAAAERATRERKERVELALKELKKVQDSKPTEEERANARVSTTDPEARVMKMADGGFRPGYNVQLATDTESRAIVGLMVTNVGSDASQMEPMLDNLEHRTAHVPDEYLVDGGFTKKEAIEHAAERGVDVYTPPQKPRKAGIDPHKPKRTDSEAVAAWRKRMGTPEAKAIYKERAATCETVNADLRHWRRLDKLNVRGQRKVLAVALWAALAYNLMLLRKSKP